MMIYCVEHEAMVKADLGELGPVHDDFYYEGFGIEYNWCEFPLGWAACPPPELDMDEFMDSVVEPDEDEMAAINAESAL